MILFFIRRSLLNPLAITRLQEKHRQHIISTIDFQIAMLCVDLYGTVLLFVYKIYSCGTPCVHSMYICDGRKNWICREFRILLRVTTHNKVIMITDDFFGKTHETSPLDPLKNHFGNKVSPYPSNETTPENAVARTSFRKQLIFFVQIIVRLQAVSTVTGCSK